MVVTGAGLSEEEEEKEEVLCKEKSYRGETDFECCEQIFKNSEKSVNKKQRESPTPIILCWPLSPF